MKKRILLFSVFTVIILMCMTLNVYAEDTIGTCGDNLTWTFEEATGTLTISGEGEMVDNPDWGGLKSSITTVVIEDGVTSIGASSFSACTKLTSITVPGSVTSIGSLAFSGCTGLKTAGPIGGGFDYEFGWADAIPSYAFWNCEGLTNITIPDSVTSIGEYAFYSCDGLTSITIPGSVTSIGNYAFNSCDGLTSITIPGSVTSIGNYTFSNCDGLTSITIPDSVTSIGNYAFNSCDGLTSITIPESVTSIRSGAFLGCTGLKTAGPIGGGYNIEFGWSDAIPESAFSSCSELTSVTIPGYITSIGDRAFYGRAKLTNVTIHEGVVTIGNYTFYECVGLTSITIPKSVTKIADYAFKNCTGLTSVKILNSEVSGHIYDFEGCTGLKTAGPIGGGYNIEFSWTDTIPEYALGGLEQITSITIPDTITSIGYSAFSYTGITSITIPKSVTSIGASAFVGNYNLKEITFLGDCPKFGSLPFKAVTATVYYPLCNDTWTEDKLSGYGGTLTWEPVLTSHKYIDSEVVPPTCSEQGYTLHTCVCGNGAYKDTFVDALPHTFDIWTVTKMPTCTEKGTVSRSCYCSDEETLPITELGHDMVSFEAKAPTCTEIGWDAYEACSRCELTTYSEKPALGHAITSVTAQPATCTDIGWDAYDICSVCDYSTYEEIPATGHSFTEWTVTTEPTCSAKGVAERSCNCGAEEKLPIKELGHKAVAHEAKSPSCTDIGWDAYEACSRCEYSTYAEIPAAGHKSVIDAAVDATCSEAGLSEGSHCSVCDEILVSQETIPSLGHDFEADFTVDIEATTDTTGQKSRHCTRCNEVTDITEIPKLPSLIDTSTIFIDVKPKSWFKSAVDYVVSNGLMNGTSATEFEPNTPMSRAMLVTVLWRLEGSPAPAGSHPFTDLKQAWYKDAVNWAFQNNIVNGTSADKFSPNGNITREQMAAIFYRYSEYKGYNITSRADITSYPDSGRVHDYALEAVSWANAEGLITGTTDNGKTVLAPRASATRAQVATILMRFCENH